jgi:hypothetical protein
LHNLIMLFYLEEGWSSLTSVTYTKLYEARNIEERSHFHCWRGKAVSITYCVCVSVALVICHAKRVRRIMLSSVASLALPYFSTLCNKRYDFRNKLLNVKGVL